MHILQTGIPKSGNSWIFMIVNQILKQADYPQQSFIVKQPIFKLAQEWPDPLPGQSWLNTIKIEGAHWYYIIGGVFKMPITDIDTYINSCTQVWTHSLFNQSHVAGLQKFSHIIYIIRDPRATLNSHSHFVFEPHIKWQHPNPQQTRAAFIDRHLSVQPRHWVQHVGHALKLAQHLNIHFVFYEQLLTQFDHELDRLLKFLNLDLDSSGRAAVTQAASFAAMKQDYPRHLRLGQAHSWQKELTAYQHQEVTAITKNMRRYLGYPAWPSQDNSDHLHIPKSLNISIIDRAIKQSRRPTWRERKHHYASVLRNYI